MKNDSYIILTEQNKDVLEDFPYFKHLVKFGKLDGEIRIHYRDDDEYPYKVSALVEGRCLKEFRTRNPRYLKVFYDGVRQDVCFYE